MADNKSESLCDSFGRRITYLRISITDRCNFKCGYCKPDDVVWKPRSEILRFEEITRIVETAAELGITKVRLTGGEPLTRKDVEQLVASINSIPGIKETVMTTNGALLTPEKAAMLKKAGLQRVNISLDTLNEESFRTVTGGGRLSEVRSGIRAAVEAGLSPVKINMVISAGTSEGELSQMKEFCLEKGLVLQTIRKFSLREGDSINGVSADRPLACSGCSRLRLTADGYLLPCLFSDREIKVDLGNVRESLLKAVEMKPESGAFCRTRTMQQIGG